MPIAECLNQILSSLHTGSKDHVPVVFLIQEFDLFAAHSKQSLLYNLFDVAQVCGNPVLVLGLTTKMDAVELLEKRVKSRFSHRSIYCYPPATVDAFLQVMSKVLLLRDEDGVAGDYMCRFNDAVQEVLESAETRSVVEQIYSTSKDVRAVLRIVNRALLALRPGTMPVLSPAAFKHASDVELRNSVTAVYAGLSPLEVCLVVAIKHCAAKQNVDVVNFEMAYEAYRDFLRARALANLLHRKDVVFKAFENLVAVEIVRPLDGVANRACPREFRMHACALAKPLVVDLARRCEGCPDAVRRWAEE
ncbi:origin recognition complex subunit 4 C-terminus-domain-containing protein [Zopfochytrium polystomum]|nr:origin recognition complex subunit 4 C-terminus-domain-containing protein [Zopfochytrium polystomum]